MIGADRIRFLNGQTTNDVRKADAAATQESCVLNAKGHLDAHIFLSATPNDIWIDSAQELRERLQTRLDRYVIADDVAIEDVTDQFALFHLLADSEPKISGAKFCFRSRRLGIDGWDLWDEAARAEAMKNTLAADYRVMDESEWEVFRIENGVPVFASTVVEITAPFCQKRMHQQFALLEVARNHSRTDNLEVLSGLFLVPGCSPRR